MDKKKEEGDKIDSTHQPADFGLLVVLLKVQPAASDQIRCEGSWLAELEEGVEPSRTARESFQWLWSDWSSSSSSR